MAAAPPPPPEPEPEVMPDAGAGGEVPPDAAALAADPGVQALATAVEESL